MSARDIDIPSKIAERLLEMYMPKDIGLCFVDEKFYWKREKNKI